jgi:SAM-dependent methyltransferase
MVTTDWEEHYQKGDTPWDKGEPSPGLIDFLDLHPELNAGDVLVPGCGLAHDVRAWIPHARRVTGMDLSPTAVKAAGELTRDQGLSAEIKVGNFLNSDSEDRFDWIFEHTLFCAITRDLRPNYVKGVLNRLKPGGDYLAVYYLLVEGEDEHPPYSSTREEIQALFSPHFEMQSECVPRSYPKRQGREWMVWWKKLG